MRSLARNSTLQINKISYRYSLAQHYVIQITSVTLRVSPSPKHGKRDIIFQVNGSFCRLMGEGIQYIYEVIQPIWRGSVIRIQVSLIPMLTIISSHQLLLRSRTGGQMSLDSTWCFTIMPCNTSSVLKRGHFKINRRTCDFTTTFKESIALRWSIVQKNQFK